MRRRLTIALLLRRRRLARRGAVLLSLAGAGQAASCAHAGAAAPATRTTRDARATLYDPASRAHLTLREVRFPSASGSLIQASFASGQAGHGAVLLLHGVGASRQAMLARAAFLHEAGFAVLLPDFRAHGASTGSRSTYGALESLDAAAAVAFLRAQACGERVGVIGISMGGAAALLGDQPLAVEALVLESVYPTLREATADRLESWLGPIGFAGRWATPVALRWIGWRTGVPESALRPIERIGAITAPLLMIAGTKDPYTRLSETQALYERAPTPKVLWTVTGAKHEDLHAFARVEYEWRVGGFLARSLGSLVVAPASADAEQGAADGQPPQRLDDTQGSADG